MGQLDQTHFLPLLDKVGIYDSIQATSHYSITRDLDGLRAALLRWSTTTHIFIAPWGEFTITLEDVKCLFKLPSFGVVDVTSCALSNSEKLTLDYLIGVNRKLSKGPRKKTNFACWTRFFFKSSDSVLGDGFGKELELAGFITFWLSQYMFSTITEDCLNEFCFSMPVKLARGKQIALALIFLGTLCWHLDRLVTDIVRTGGCYLVLSSINSAFL